jgi:cytidine deaminase
MAGKKKLLNIVVTEHDDVSSLKKEERKLLERASEASKNAYAPYSNFNVGAAVELEDGTIVTGNNQENAAYPSGLCAERVAIFSAAAQHSGKKMKAIAITAFSGKVKVTSPIAPCGACRQVIAEYEKRYQSPIRLILKGEEGGVITIDSASSLLPLIFDRSSLGK